MDLAQETLLTDRQRYWLEHIQACEAQGKTVAEYATGQGIEAKAMYAGKKVLVKKGILPRNHQSRFQRAQVTALVSDSAWRVQLSNGLSVTFSGAVDARILSTILTTAAAVE
jgi:hypothetical protein